METTFGSLQFTPPALDDFTGLKRDSCASRERSTWLSKLTETVPSLELDRVIGLLPSGPGAIAYGPRSLVAYTASRFVVLYDPQHDVQQRFLSSLERSHAIGCLAFSRDGAVLAAGEVGQQPAPAVLVWRVKKGEKVASRELRGHKYGVAGVAFSHEGELLASVGSGYDGQVIIWSWEHGLALVKQRAQVDLTGVAFTPDSKKIVTTGKEHFKLWVLQSEPSGRRVHGKGSLALLPKPAMNGVLKNVVYADVKSAGKGIGGVCAVTRGGTLCLMWGTSRVVDKQINLNVAMAYGLAVSDTKVACACSSGVVKLYKLKDLAFLAQLPFPEDRHRRKEPPALNSRGEVLYPDAVACAFHHSGEVLCVIYSNRTMIFWDVKDKSQIRSLRTIENHSSAIFDIVAHPATTQQNAGRDGGPKLVFASCSSDGTARLWACEKRSSSLDANSSGRLSKLSPDGSKQSWSAGGTEWRSTSKVINVGADSTEPSTSEGGNAACLRAVKVSPDGEYLAVGDDDGNLRVYELHGGELVMKKAVHNGPLNRLSFSEPQADDEKLLLASGGTDGQVVLFDMDDFDGDQVVKFKDHHQKDICGVSFAEGGSKIISCGRDKYMTFRSLQQDSQAEVSGNSNELWFHNQYLPRVLQYDMSVNDTRKVAMAACSDRKVRMWCLDTGTLIHTFETSKKAEDPIRITEGPLPTTVVCCHANATACLYEYFTGQLLANATGHSELLTGAAVIGGGSYLATSGTDGCIFIWKIRQEILNTALTMARKEGAASETGLVAPMCEEMRSKLPSGTESPLTPSQRRQHPSVIRMRQEALLAPRAVDRGARNMASVPRLNLKGIGAGPPDVVKIDQAEILEVGLSSVSISSQSKKSLERKDSDDSTKDTWTGGASSTVISNQNVPLKKLLRKEQTSAVTFTSTTVASSKPGHLYEDRVDIRTIPANIEHLAQPQTGATPARPGHLDDYVDEYNHPRVLQWIKDHAQPTVKTPEQQNAVNIDLHGSLDASAVSEKKQRTKWCIPELPKSPPSKESPRYPWSERSQEEEKVPGHAMELSVAFDGKAPWSETESELGKDATDTYESETSFHGALVRSKLSMKPKDKASMVMTPAPTSLPKVTTDKAPAKLSQPKDAAAGRPGGRPSTPLFKDKQSVLLASGESVKARVAKQSSIPKRSNRHSNTSWVLDSTGSSSAKGPESSSFGYKRSHEARKPSDRSEMLSTESTVEQMLSTVSSIDKRVATAAAAVQAPNSSLERKVFLKKKTSSKKSSSNSGGKSAGKTIDQAVERPDGAIRTTSTKAYCNPIYDDIGILEDDSGAKSQRSTRKGMFRIGADSDYHDNGSQKECASQAESLDTTPAITQTASKEILVNSSLSPQGIASRRLHASRDSLASCADPPGSFQAKRISTDCCDDPPEALAIGSSPRERCTDQHAVAERPLSAPPPSYHQLYSDMEYLPAVKWSTNSKEDSTKGFPVEVISVGGSITSSRQESDRLEPPHSVDTAVRGGRSPRVQEQQEQQEKQQQPVPRRLFSKEKPRQKFDEACRIDTGSSTGMQSTYQAPESTGAPIDTGRVFLSKGLGSVAGGEELLGAWESVTQAAHGFSKVWKKFHSADGNVKASLKVALMEELSKNLFGEKYSNVSTMPGKHISERLDESTQTTGLDSHIDFADEMFKRFQSQIDQAMLQMRCELTDQFRS